MWIVITGNPVDGFEHIGPFTSFDAAHDSAQTDGNIEGGDWWITQLTAPEEVK